MRPRKSKRIPQYHSDAYVKLIEWLGENVRRRRKHLSLSQEEAAHRCGMSTYQFQRVESSITNVTFTTLARLVEGLRVPAARLLLDAQQAERLERERGESRARPPERPLLAKSDVRRVAGRHHRR
jgi:transcriptional regulator with XRE-family HTH domain